MKYAWIFASFIPTYVFSQDRVFAYTYQTNVLSKGDFDLEFQNTLRTGKVGPYSPYIFGQHLDQRLELEAGLGRGVQTAFYFNSEVFHYADTSSKAIDQELAISFSNEWKWKLSDPVANAVGTALYGEIEVGGSNVELEGKLIMDKQVRRNLIALNAVARYEVEKEIGQVVNSSKLERVHDTQLEADVAYMHFVKPGLGIGAEMRNVNDITQEDGWKTSTFFIGPAFHGSIGKFFVNLTALPQICNLHKTASAPGNRDLNGFEAVEVRALVGYSF